MSYHLSAVNQPIADAAMTLMSARFYGLREQFGNKSLPR